MALFYQNSKLEKQIKSSGIRRLTNTVKDLIYSVYNNRIEEKMIKWLG